MNGKKAFNKKSSLFFYLIVFLCLATILIPIFAAGSLLLQEINKETFYSSIGSSSFWKTLWFTLYQGALSSGLSVIPAFPIAYSLWQHNFFGKNRVLHLLGACFVTPPIVAAFGIINIHGGSGWLTQLFSLLGFNLPSYSYGLSGILLAHIFFNLPFAVLVFYHGLNSIPTQNLLLAQQFGLRFRGKFSAIFWPFLKGTAGQLGVFIFLLCCTSFAIILTLGRGPATTTLEVEIYQALRYEFDISRAAFLALTQTALALIFLQYLEKRSFFPEIFQPHARILEYQNTPEKKGIVFFTSLIALCVFAFLPLLSNFSGIFQVDFFLLPFQYFFLKAIKNTLGIALASATLSVFATIFLNMAFRENYFFRLFRSIPSVILVFSPFFLATGFFILLQRHEYLFEHKYLVVILINAIMTLPFTQRVLGRELGFSFQKYSTLSRSLGLNRFRFFCYVDFPLVRSAVFKAWSIAAGLSVGDLSVISLFGSENFITLPLLLSRLMGSYRNNDASVVAIWLCLLAFGFFLAPEFLHRTRKQV